MTSMSMYLSIQDVGPTGYEPCEFLELPTMAPEEPNLDRPRSSDEDNDDDGDEDLSTA